MLRLLTILVAGLGCAGAAAADDDNFVELPKSILVQPYMEIPSVDLDLAKTEYQPNTDMHLGVSVSYGPVGFSLSYGLDDTDDDAKYGKTTYIDQGIGYSARRWGVYARYQHYKGFYSQTDDGDDNGSNGDDDTKPITKHPDLSLTNYELNGIFVLFKDQFSLRAGLDQGERQLTSGGSPLAMASLQDLDARATTPLDGGLTRISALSLSVLGGYGYLWANGPFYLMVAGLMGVGAQSLTFTADGATTHKVDTGTKLDAEVSLGHNGDVWVYGMMFNLLATSTQRGSEDIDYSSLPITFFGGMRL